jgi:3-isopropylmalate/(R)-2-methylmalate dehydratase large subunit
VLGATAAEKILSRAVGQPVRAGEIHYPEPDLVTLHDWYINNCIKALDDFGVTDALRPERVMVSTDHEPVALSPAAVERQKQARENAARFNFGHFYDVGRGGLGHVFPVEIGLVKPGMFVQGYDPHLTNFGAVGALGIAVLNEVAELIACGSVWTLIPETLRIDVSGQLPFGVTIRDAAQWLIGNFDADLFDDAVIEFGGPGIVGLSIDQRMTLVNTTVELGARSALVEPDRMVADYYRSGGHAPGDFVLSDQNAAYRDRLALRMNRMEPQIAVPPRPDLVRPLATATGTHINHAYIGSCASGFIEDLRVAARILDGKKIAAHVRLFVTPVTQRVAQQAADEGLLRIFIDAGAIVTAPGCGVCAGGRIGGVANGEVSIGTGTRNDPGRLGGDKAELFIASPATVAASALAGAIADPRSLEALAA